MQKLIIYTVCLLLSLSALQSQTLLRGKVIDQDTKQPISNAKIGVTSQGVGVITDSAGRFMYRKYDKVLDIDSKLLVSAKGYAQIELGIDKIRAIYDTPSTIPLVKSQMLESINNGAITIYFDISEGMVGRDIDKELTYIENRLSAFESKEVNFVLFDYKIRSWKTQKVLIGDISSFRESISNIDYAGPADYDLLQTEGAAAVWLFSNGNKTFGHIDARQKIPVTIVSSHSKYRDIKNLQEIAQYTSGEVILLDKDHSKDIVNQNIQKASVPKGVEGRITSLEKPIQGAAIMIKGSLAEVLTNADGTFVINATEGDILQISYLGMYTKELLIQNKENLDVELIPKNDMLDEITLIGQKEQFVVNNRIEKGSKVKGAPGGITRRGYFYVTEKDIVPDGNTIEQVMQKLFNGVRVSTNPYGDPVFTIFGKSYAFYINGAKWQAGSTLPFHIPDNEIASIIIKDDDTYATKFGIPEPGRMVIITTKNDSELQASLRTSALVKGNDYKEENLNLINAESTVVVTDNTTNSIRGVVMGEGKPIQGATIVIKGSFDEVYTSVRGRFNLEVQEGDILLVSALGMFTKEVLVEEQKSDYTINLVAKSNNLNEVVVAGNKRVDNTIETGFGKENKDKLGYAVSGINKKQFNTGATTLRDLIVGRFAGVTVKYNAYEGSSYRIRSTGSINDDIPPIWIVDGTPYQDEPAFVDVQRIQNITVLKSLKATNKYGSIARGGAFVIITQQFSEAKAASNNQGLPLATGNEYKEELVVARTAEDPSYIKQIKKFKTPSSQLDAYRKIARTQELSLEFYSDVVRYFQKIDPSSADVVRADLAYIARNNTKALRTLAYLYEEAGDEKKMLSTYNRVLTIASGEAQSYRDVANAYIENKEYNKALEIYINMLGERVKGVNFNGVESLLKTELLRLANLYKDKIEFDRLPNTWFRTDFNQDVRMVIEYSDPTVPFEFQFVNPSKKFYKWNHTLEENRERLEQERKQGFQLEEFIIDDAPEGEWIVNLQYLGEKGDYILPPFLKYTIYRNYGTTKETKHMRVIKLFKQSEKVTIGKITI